MNDPTKNQDLDTLKTLQAKLVIHRAAYNSSESHLNTVHNQLIENLDNIEKVLNRITEASE